MRAQLPALFLELLTQPTHTIFIRRNHGECFVYVVHPCAVFSDPVSDANVLLLTALRVNFAYQRGHKHDKSPRNILVSICWCTRPVMLTLDVLLIPTGLLSTLWPREAFASVHRSQISSIRSAHTFCNFSMCARVGNRGRGAVGLHPLGQTRQRVLRMRSFATSINAIPSLIQSNCIIRPLITQVFWHSKDTHVKLA